MVSYFYIEKKCDSTDNIMNIMTVKSGPRINRNLGLKN